jgi:mono/diheme cytochrome c family protein
MSRITVSCFVVLLFVLTGLQAQSRAQEQPGRGAKSEMHHPEKWRFTLHPGNPARGREAFVKFECYSCHQVLGEKFPEPGGDAIGPELSQMASMHPREYFVEAIMNPSAVIEDRYRAADGRSKMPSFNDIMTVEELIDLAAFLKSLGGAHTPSPGGQKH